MFENRVGIMVKFMKISKRARVAFQLLVNNSHFLDLLMPGDLVEKV